MSGAASPATHDVRPEEAGFFYMDVMRFFAAAAVVLNHVRDLTLVDAGQAQQRGIATLALYVLAGFGHQSVMIFFVLSGFWITGAVVRRQDRATFWRDFMIDRLSRLLIVVMPALLLGGVLDAVGMRLVAGAYDGSSGAHSMPDVAATLTPTALLGNLLFVQRIIVPPFGSNGPLWSLAYEFWYYAWFPALWLSLRRRRLSLALIAFGMAIFNPHLAFGFLSWLCGSTLFFVLQDAVRRGLAGKRRLAGPLLYGGAAGLIAALALARWQGGAPWTDLVVSATFAVMLLGLCLWVPERRRLFQPLATYGARASFSLYAIHYPLAAIVLGFTLGGNRVQPEAAGLAIVGGLLLALIATGWVFAAATERHTGVFRDRLRALVARRAGTA